MLARLGAASARSHKCVTPHSRQQWERQLAGERGLRLADLEFFLQGFTPEQRRWALEPLLLGATPVPKAPLVEIAEATEATGRALSMAQRFLARPAPRDRREVEVLAGALLRASSEVADVLPALRRVE